MIKVAYIYGDREDDAIRGIGIYNRELVPRLQNLGKKNGLEIDLLGSSAKINPENYDLVHYPFFDFFLNSYKPIKNVKNVVTIYDTIPLIYPQHYSPGLFGMLNLVRQKKSLAKADAVVTLTETSRKDIVRFLNFPTEKVYPVYSGLGNRNYNKYKKRYLDKYKPQFKFHDRYALYVGDINYNKNLETLIDACEIANVNLVIVGKNATEIESLVKKRVVKGLRDFFRELSGRKHPEVVHLEKIWGKIKDNRKIERLGFLENEVFAAVFCNASVYVQPSLYEGFGMVVLEAFSAGIPVVSAKTQALVEVAGNSALFADPQDPNDFAEKIKQVLSNNELRAKLILSGRKRQKDFSWTKTSKKIIELYLKLCSKVSGK